MKKQFLLITLLFVSSSLGMNNKNCKKFQHIRKTKQISLIDRLSTELILQIVFYLLSNANNIDSAIQDFENFAYFLEQNKKHILKIRGRFNESDIKIFSKSGWNAFFLSKKFSVQLSNDFKKKLIDNLLKEYGYKPEEFEEWFSKKINNFTDKEPIRKYYFDECFNKKLHFYPRNNQTI